MLLPKGLLYAARSYPDKIAVVGGNHRYSYQQLEIRTAKVKASLSKLGAKKGDRIGLLLLNDFRYLELMYGATALGAIIVPMNTRFSVEEHIYVLEDAGVEILYVNKEFLTLIPEIQKRVPTIRHIILAEDENDQALLENKQVESYEKLLVSEPIEILTYDDIHEEDIAGLFYTGGTTGRSKGVMLSHKSLVANAMHVVINFKNKKEDIYLHAAPMFHLADQASTFAVTLTGGTHVTLRQFTPKGFLEIVEQERVSMTMLVPTMINMILHSADFEKYDTSSLQFILYGASPMATELLKKTMNLLPRISLIQAYGMTEAAPILTLLLPEDHNVSNEQNEKRLTSCGKPVQLVDMKVVGPDGNELPTNEIGEFVARGPNIMNGYWRLEDETSKVLQDGWYSTGDMGYMDEDGYFYVVDRAKDMIISGGENVYSVEVEQALYMHPAVLECAVFGAPDKEWGEVVRAAVVLKPGVTSSEEEILTFLRTKVANYKVPKSIEFLLELPKSGAGKILKRVIRDQFIKQPVNE
ncbi:long-chain-fatty-acid--CoA ligase [Sporosarcina ureilytica]|uniref:Fatty-acid--CoA ligase n=1 Tax=Sporosarcina ureilytica TaxID=298596 RepID=A0A1D8JEK4_9BACL|nr:long-chain-fatty-acid--CoA ligase [Sporosarcina ureilytica]AOV07152.1 hypothetical protein BI350_06100 [Sporosarcina ureilytica]